MYLLLIILRVFISLDKTLNKNQIEFCFEIHYFSQSLNYSNNIFSRVMKDFIITEILPISKLK